MKIHIWLASGIVFGVLGMAIASVPAQAKNKTVKECTAEWKAAEAAKTTGGKKKAEFMAACRQETAAAPAAAAPAAPAATAPAAAPAPAPSAEAPAAPASKKTSKKPSGSPGREAMVARERACGKEWKEAKAAGNVPAGQTWPKYWHECDQRMKAKGM